MIKNNKYFQKLASIDFTRFLLLYFTLFLLVPLIYSITRPFYFWDCLTCPETLWNGCVPQVDILSNDSLISFRKIFSNYYYSFFQHGYLFRPNGTLIIHLQYIFFGGEFWIWQLLRWAVKMLIIYLLFKSLKALSFDNLTCWCLSCFILLHPVFSELQLFDSEPWGVLGVALLLFFTLKQSKESRVFNLREISFSSYLILLALYFFILGIKPTFIVFSWVFLLLLTFYDFPNLRKNYGKFLLAYAPFYSLLAIVSGRIYLVSKTRAEAGFAPPLKAFQDFSFIKLFIPPSPFYIITLFGCLFVVFSLIALRFSNKKAQFIVVLCLGAILGNLILLSLSGMRVAPRYMRLNIFLLAFPLALGLNHLKPLLFKSRVFFKATRLRILFGGLSVVKIAFLLFYPLLTSYDIHAQSLSFYQQSSEFSENLWLIQERVSRKYPLAFSGHFFEKEGLLGIEGVNTIHLFLKRYARHFYNLQLPEVKIHYLTLTKKLRQKYLLFTTYSPQSIGKGTIKGVSLKQIGKIHLFKRHHYGFLEKQTNFFKRLNGFVGNSYTPTYDLGTREVYYSSTFYLYEINPEKEGELLKKEPIEGKAFWYTSNKSEKVVLAPGDRISFKVKPGETFALQLPLPFQTHLPLFKGEIFINRGKVSFGISDGMGNDLWNSRLYHQKRWQKLSVAELLTPHKYPNFTDQKYFFIFVDSNWNKVVDFELRNIAMEKAIPLFFLNPPVNHGGFLR